MTAPALRTVLFERVQNALRAASTGDSGDQADRLVLAAMLAAGAITLAWPQQKATPKLIVGAARVVGEIWKRRALWLPGVESPSR